MFLPGPLVDVSWLQSYLDHEQLVIFDASWHLPGSGRDALTEWRQSHIPGALFFDFDTRICDPSSSLPHMMPSPPVFEREVRRLGLNDNSVVVVYDSVGIFSCARAWWMLRAMGCKNCAILDGGLPAWREVGAPLEEGEPAAVVGGDFTAHFDHSRIVDSSVVLEALEDAHARVIDARPAARFRGEADEPRPNSRKGHMPGAVNMPYSELLEDGRFRSMGELRALLDPLIEERERVICSCGSGVTACIVGFAAELVGCSDVAVYDGSWAEWGSPGPLPVVTKGANDV